MSDVNTKSEEDVRLDIHEEGDENEVADFAIHKADATFGSTLLTAHRTWTR